MIGGINLKEIGTVKGFIYGLMSLLKRNFYVQTFPLRRDEYLSKKIVACVFSVGERTEEQSISSVKRQKLPVSRIEVIRNVSPISAASNRVFDLASDSDYVLWVDADMILYENCTEYLIRLAKKNVLFATGGLIDPVFGVIGHVKLLNMRLAKKLDIRFRNVLGCDIDFYEQAKNKDNKIIPTYGVMRKILGIHHYSYTAQELFRKTQIRKKKMGKSIDKNLVLSLARKYSQTDNSVLLAGILGAILPNPDNLQRESSPESGLENWDIVSSLFGCSLEHQVFGNDQNLRKKNETVIERMKTEKLLVPISNVYHINLSWLKTRTADYFGTLNFSGKRMLDIGAGTGLYACCVAALGADKLVALEPEEKGSSNQAIATFRQNIDRLGLKNIDLQTLKLQEYIADHESFDIVYMLASINHINEKHVRTLHRNKDSWDAYIHLLSPVFELLKPGGILIISDASRYHAFSLLTRLEILKKHPFLPNIEWEKHQHPKVWKILLEDIGFRSVHFHWATQWRYQWMPRLLVDNPISVHLYTSLFVIHAKKA